MTDVERLTKQDVIDSPRLGFWVHAGDFNQKIDQGRRRESELQQRLTAADDKNDTISTAYVRAGEREHELRLRVHKLGNLLSRWAGLLGVSAPDLRDETLSALKPEAPNEPCACPDCDASKAYGSLFCADHKSAKSRTRGQDPFTAELVAAFNDDNDHRPERDE